MSLGMVLSEETKRGRRHKGRRRRGRIVAHHALTWFHPVAKEQKKRSCQKRRRSLGEEEGKTTDVDRETNVDLHWCDFL